MGTLITLFLHFKMKMTQPMIYSSVSGLIDLWYNPLVQIYLIGKKAEGSLRGRLAARRRLGCRRRREVRRARAAPPMPTRSRRCWAAWRRRLRRRVRRTPEANDTRLSVQ